MFSLLSFFIFEARRVCVLVVKLSWSSVYSTLAGVVKYGSMSSSGN
jgi:hypothetical protein